MATIYVVVEVKTVPEGNAVLITTTQHSTRNGAESQFYSRLASAANPSDTFPIHAVTLMTNEGFVIESKSYAHEVVPPEPEGATNEGGEE